MILNKIAIIGAGAVGSATAYTLMEKNIASTIILVDVNEKKCFGEVQDISDAATLGIHSKIIKGSLIQAGQADIAIICAGFPQMQGQTRIELLKKNSEIIKEIINKMQPINPNLIMIMVTNPVDILTYLCQKISGLPKNQIFGSGTFLDSLRLRYEIAERLNISSDSVNVDVIGEHGDSQFPIWSQATINGLKLVEYKKFSDGELEQFAKIAKHKAYNIIENKGCTNWAIAKCVAYYCKNIIFNTLKIIPVSCYYEEKNIAINLPAILSNKGIEKIILPNFNDHELKQFNKSIEILIKNTKDLIL